MPLEPAQASELLERLPVAVALIDAQNRMAWSNRRYGELVGTTPIERLIDASATCDNTPRRLRLPLAGNADSEIVAHCLQAAHYRMLVLDDVAGELHSAQLRELTTHLAELEREAMVDPLTGAWNRRYLDHAMAAETNRSRRYRQPLSGALLDIDHFKRVNDTWGHQAGDTVLRELAAILKGGLRAADLLVRWGGEEFLIVMPYTTHYAAASTAEKLRALVAAHEFTGVGRVTVSLGVAEYFGAETADEFFARLDRGLYQAKNAGRDRIVCDPRGPSDEWEANRSILQLVWNDSYESGNAVIDAEHRELFRLANELIEASLKQPEDRAALDAALDRCLSHIAHHFRDEEAILSQRGYAKLAQHQEAHRMLLVRGAQLKLAASRADLSTGTLVQFLAREVVARHMIMADRDFFPLFAGRPGS